MMNYESSFAAQPFALAESTGIGDFEASNFDTFDLEAFSSTNTEKCEYDRG